MQPQDKPAFYQALNIMAAMFSDPLSELRLRGYWDMLADECTLEEWEHACAEAMRQETFHKVPLPAKLMEYIWQFRSARREEQRAHEQAERYAAEKRLLAEPSPADIPSHEETLALIRECIAKLDSSTTMVNPQRRVRWPTGPLHPAYLEQPIDYEQRKTALVQQALWVVEHPDVMPQAVSPYEPPSDNEYLSEPEEDLYD